MKTIIKPSATAASLAMMMFHLTSGIVAFYAVTITKTGANSCRLSLKSASKQSPSSMDGSPGCFRV